MDCEPDLDALLCAADAARYARRFGRDGKPNVKVIVNWRNRGHLAVATRDDGTEIRDSRGRPLYRLRDVARADALTSQRGEQMARRLLERTAPAA